MSKRTQTQRLLEILRYSGGVCAMEPLRWEPPITRVAARIHDLRRRGHAITTATTCQKHGGAHHAFYRYQ